VGGKDKDMFVYESLNDGTDTIKGFSLLEDVVDLRQIFLDPAFSTGSGYRCFSRFVDLVEVGGSTEMRVDLDGSGLNADTATLAVFQGVVGLTCQNFVVR
jgi:hypothetical protein